MATAKSYFQDRLVLLLLSVNAFLAFLATVLILFRVGSSGGSGFIVQYRENLGISAFKTGSVTSLLAFIGFALIVLAANTVLSWRSYRIRRQLSLAILGLGIVLLLLCIIVSNALLALR
jgi:uncharacterized membrane protein